MDALGPSSVLSSFIEKYRVHIFVFFLVFFIGITFAHPAVLLNDEFITANQIRQIHAGHQFIINEGRYGLAQNGSMSGYFYYRSNILGYSIFLPLISLPAFWMIDLFGGQIGYLILVVWTMMALLLLLLINHFFKKFSYIGRWQWTTIAAAVIFLLFFVNLYYYSWFTVDEVNSYPEILAIVMTNMLLLALSGMFIYEICRTIFEETAFSFFGAIVCFFSSSYFLWSTFCKDHVLVLACFVPIVLFLVRFIKTDEYWYLPMAFMGCGLLAWARPEVALWMAFLVTIVFGYTLFRFHTPNGPAYSLYAIIFSPAFTFLGALPFFINNLVTTGNIFLPTQSLYLTDGNVTTAVNTSKSMLRIGGVDSTQSIITKFLPAIPTSPIETFRDFIGVFFYPTTGHIAVLTLVPVFLVMIILGTILLIFKKIRFNQEEKRMIVLAFLIFGFSFLAYASQLHLLNTDGGITPDIRYLSPIYFVLTLIGLIILRNIQIFPKNTSEILKEMSWITIIGTPLSIIILCLSYPLNPDFIKGVIPLGKFFNWYVIGLTILTLIMCLYFLYKKWGKDIIIYMILLLYAVPFFWQVNAILVYFTWSGFAGHIFWIPIIRVLWELIAKFIFITM
jgi:hypothetical protein